MKFAAAQTQHTQHTKHTVAPSNKPAAQGRNTGDSASGGVLKQTALTGYIKSLPKGQVPVGGPDRIMKKQAKRNADAEDNVSKVKRTRRPQLDSYTEEDDTDNEDSPASFRSLISGDKCSHADK